MIIFYPLFIDVLNDFWLNISILETKQKVLKFLKNALFMGLLDANPYKRGIKSAKIKNTKKLFAVTTLVLSSAVLVWKKYIIYSLIHFYICRFRNHPLYKVYILFLGLRAKSVCDAWCVLDR